jgi:hypothetical protein
MGADTDEEIGVAIVDVDLPGILDFDGGVPVGSLRIRPRQLAVHASSPLPPRRRNDDRVMPKHRALVRGERS